MLRLAPSVFVDVTMSTSDAKMQDRIKKDDLTYMADEEPAMQRAIARARAELDGFLAKAKSPPADTFGFAVKVAIRDRDVTEYFWVSPFTEADGRFIGKVDNEPRTVRTVKAGQSYAFVKSEIVDWMYASRTVRKVYGNYTMCALLTKEPPKEAEGVRKRFGLDCEP